MMATKRQAQYGDTGGDTWFVKTLSGRTIAVHVRDGTVGGLKAAVAERVGVAPADQVLAYAGRVIGDDGGAEEEGEGEERALRLAECGVPRGATLHLSLRLRGGLGAGQVLMLAQAIQMVYAPVRECIRSTWNSCAKEENQCPQVHNHSVHRYFRAAPGRLLSSDRLCLQPALRLPLPGPG